MKSPLRLFALVLASVVVLTVLLEAAHDYGVGRGPVSDLLFSFLRGAVVAAAVFVVLRSQQRAQSAHIEWPAGAAAAPAVAYCLGPRRPTFAERARLGRLHLDSDTLHVEGSPPVTIALSEVQAVDWEPVWGARLLRVEHGGGTLFVVPIRRSFFGGWGLLSHRPLTAALHRELLGHLQPATSPV